MQRFEGVSDLSSDEIVTYKHLTLSLVLSNALSEYLKNTGEMPRRWDMVGLGTDFDPCMTPILRKDPEGDLWVEYFNCDRPKDALALIAGEAAKSIPEVGAVIPRRPPRPHRDSASPDNLKPRSSVIMELVRQRMKKQSGAASATMHGAT